MPNQQLTDKPLFTPKNNSYLNIYKPKFKFLKTPLNDRQTSIKKTLFKQYYIYKTVNVLDIIY